MELVGVSLTADAELDVPAVDVHQPAIIEFTLFPLEHTPGVCGAGAIFRSDCVTM